MSSSDNNNKKSQARKILREMISPIDGIKAMGQTMGRISNNLSELYGYATGKNSKTQAKSDDYGFDDIIKRYRNLRISASISLIFATWSFTAMFFVGTKNGLVTAVLAFLLCGLSYIGKCRMLYKMRLCLADWENHKSISITWQAYLNAIARDCKDLLPRKARLI